MLCMTQCYCLNLHLFPQDVVQFAITVRDHNQYVDRMRIDFLETDTITTNFSASSSFIGRLRRASIRLRYRITSKCPNAFTYGPTCDIICHSNTTYYCNYLGTRVCESGYYPPGDCSQFCYTYSCSTSTGKSS